MLSTTTKKKKIEVSGGFYSEEDMRNELSYSQSFGINSNPVFRAPRSTEGSH